MEGGIIKNQKSDNKKKDIIQNTNEADVIVKTDKVGVDVSNNLDSRIASNNLNMQKPHNNKNHDEELASLIENLKERISDEEEYDFNKEIEFSKRKEPIYVDVADIDTILEHAKSDVSKYKQNEINWQKIASAKMLPIEEGTINKEATTAEKTNDKKVVDKKENPVTEADEVLKETHNDELVIPQESDMQSQDILPDDKNEDHNVEVNNPATAIPEATEVHDIEAVIPEATEDHDFEAVITEATEDHDFEAVIPEATEDHDFESVVEIPKDTDYENKVDDESDVDGDWVLSEDLLNDDYLNSLLNFEIEEEKPAKTKRSSNSKPVTKKTKTTEKKLASKKQGAETSNTAKKASPKTSSAVKTKTPKNRSRTAGLDLPDEGSIIYIELNDVKEASWKDVVYRRGHHAYHVTPVNNGGWFVKRSGNANPSAYAAKKDEAVEIAKKYAKREKATLKIHNKKGVIVDSISYGRVTKSKIEAEE